MRNKHYKREDCITLSQVYAWHVVRAVSCSITTRRHEGLRGNENRKIRQIVLVSVSMELRRTCLGALHASPSVTCETRLLETTKHNNPATKKSKKRPKSLLFLVPEIGHQSAPDLCGIEVSLEFTKDISIPQFWEPHLVPVSGHKNRVQFLSCVFANF